MFASNRQDVEVVYCTTDSDDPLRRSVKKKPLVATTIASNDKKMATSRDEQGRWIKKE